jgi:hypothetical protein
MRRLAVLVILAAGAAIGVAPPAQAYHGGRPVTSAIEAPYVVLVEARLPGARYLCTGSIIDPAHVLTAAHCALGDDGRPFRAAAYRITAGVTARSQRTAPGAQQRRVASARVHPSYTGRVPGFADVAVLEVDRPFDLTPTVAPIALVPPGLPPPAGTVVRGYGFGLDRLDDAVSDEHTLDMTVRRPLECIDGYGGVTCARSVIGTGCPGDSGGPLVTIGPAPQLAGVMSGGTDNRCARGETAWFADLSSRGLADWVAGRPAPPPLPRVVRRAAMALPTADGAGIGCSAATWAGAVEGATAFYRESQLVQSGPQRTYVPQPADVGHDLLCVSLAIGEGGVAQGLARGFVAVQPGRDGALRLCLQGMRPRATCRAWRPSRAAT